MRIYHFVLPLLGVAVVTVPIQAQTSQSNPLSPHSSAGEWITQLQPDQWQASKLEGLAVYSSNNGDKIGDVISLIFDSNGKVQAVLIGVGGYLGIGERNIAVPFDQIRFESQPRGTAARTVTGEARLAGTNPGGDTVASPAATGTAAVPPGSSGPAANMAANNASAPVAPETRITGQAAPGDDSTPDHAVLMMSITKDELRMAPEFRAPR